MTLAFPEGLRLYFTNVSPCHMIHWLFTLQLKNIGNWNLKHLTSRS